MAPLAPIRVGAKQNRGRGTAAPVRHLAGECAVHLVRSSRGLLRGTRRTYRFAGRVRVNVAARSSQARSVASSAKTCGATAT
jgi:hypothetical protein